MEAFQTELRQILAAHANQIERNKQAIYDLLGGLFQQSQQKDMLDHLIDLLFGEDTTNVPSPVFSWPTTRQGDAHEKRIKYLEDKLQKLEQKITQMESRQEPEPEREQEEHDMNE
jgi:hypothetical protein